ncbi:VanZ family protein [Haloferula chungangensis]|uniref:VanZ family protein n=1 Tax=Haloferula chungangensis TaxID=1048331 RepID=A0ABW2KZP6_9BACT
MRLPRHPAIWFAAFAVWFVTLWVLSSEARHVPPGLEFRHLDKLVHFGYFFGGAGLLSAAIFCHRPALHPSTRMLIVIILVTLVGAIDEAHQSFIPNRSGNDAGDLISDFLGAIAGAMLFQRLKHFLAD